MHVLLGAEPIHDYHCGQGSFAQAIRDITQSDDACVTTYVTRSNFRSLEDLPATLSRVGVVGWCLAPAPSRAGIDAVSPRLALAAPRMLHALARAERMNIETWIADVPLCLLGPYADRALPRPQRELPGGCEACAAEAGCPGVSRAYLDLFDGDELRARSACTRRTGSWSDAFAPLPSWTGNAST